MRTNRDFDRSIVVDCYAQHPEKYGRTFWASDPRTEADVSFSKLHCHLH
jgi:hypothetical protein